MPSTILHHAGAMFQRYREASLHSFILLGPWGSEKAKVPEAKDGTWQIVDAQAALEHFKSSRNVGLVLGPHKLLVLDIDVDPQDGDGAEPLDVRQVLDAFGLPTTAVAVTGSRGLHVYLRDPGDAWDVKPPQPKLRGARAVHLKRGNSYTVIPPSVHENGRRYMWAVLNDAILALGAADVAPVPAEWLAPRKVQQVPTGGEPENPELLEAGIRKLAAALGDADKAFAQEALIGEWPREQTPGVDRSGAEYRLAALCREGGLTEEETAAVVAASAVHRAKFENRNDRMERLKAVVEAVFEGCTERRVTPQVLVGKIWSADELAKADLPEPSWLLPGLLPAQGLTVLAGRPKVGKSWLALDIALSLAAGKEVLGLRPSTEVVVLYIALEDSPHRLKNRLEMAGLPAPREGLITTAFPSMPDALEELDKLIPRFGLKLIVIDTWARFRPPRRGRSSDIYAQDYQEVSALKQFLDAHGIAGLLVHHLNQAKDVEHWTDRILGSTGLIGGPDALLALMRAQQGTVLHAIGRDIPETELAVKFENHRWRVLGAADQVHMSETRKQILEALRLLNGGTPQEVADYTGRPPSTVRRLLAHLHRDGLAVKVKARYSPVEGLIIKHRGNKD